MLFVHTIQEIQGMITAHGQFKATLGEADKEFNAIIGFVEQVRQLASTHNVPGGLENPYTSLSANVRCDLIN
jgi:actinin alpha